MKNHSRYESAKVAQTKTFRHDLSHQHLTTMDFYRLQPLAVFECVPRDKMHIDIQSIVESAPLATKVYGSYHLDLQAFFVPYRLVWDNWENYINRVSDNNLLPPCIDFSAHSATLFQSLDTDSDSVKATKSARRHIFGSLGYPVNNYDQVLNEQRRVLSLLPARCFQQVWWDWYRDSVNLNESNKPSYLYKDGGEVSKANFTAAFAPRYRTFRKDYITTMLTTPQSALPGQSAEGALVEGMNDTIDDPQGSAYPIYFGQSISGDVGAWVSSDCAGTDVRIQDGQQLLSSLRIPVLRGAIAMQRFMEKLGISGTRPLERIMSMFGVRPEPQRLQMSELIGTKSISIGVDGLINNGTHYSMGERGAQLQGNPFGSTEVQFFGTQIGKSHQAGRTETWHYNATEHGCIIVVGSIIPDYINDGFIPAIFTRGVSSTSEGANDFYTDELDGSGYKAVTLGEIANPLGYPNAGSQNGWDSYDLDKVVGFHPRYEDYRYIMDRLSGDFNEEQSLEYLRNMAFVRSLPSVLTPNNVVAGLNLTTPTENDRSYFDNHFLVTDSSMDHFVLNNWIVCDAERPISSAILPDELSNLANKDLVEISRGGIRL